ncbi:formylglycine-generating enzyme family protein [Pontibacter sp. G13]|uniref:formylglycine-generating enzyme family protein n=1 Tax=Pontibacter sp. G13 TaxID=3074898 RepID=UPI00288BFFC3|nr:formylglycine-generating enzyme family protein [Pontibacter sp. G13]WNJ18738.1 formylglycine-generating enzyme family protein [Pontibacter sp. G13]
MPKPTLLRPPSTPAELESSMIFVEGGEFWMGSDEDHSFGESPRHQVRLSDFEMSRFPVSQALWESVMGHNPARFEHPDRPVERVSWMEIVEGFLPKLNEMTERIYRLPTEAEWEYAARGGRISQNQMGWEDFIHAGGDRMHELGWYVENSRDESAILGTKLQNTIGLKDMNGNTWDWCLNRHQGFNSDFIYQAMKLGKGITRVDWFNANLDDYFRQCFKKGKVDNPIGPAKGSGRVVRGGSWNYESMECRVAIRLSAAFSRQYSDIGFRLVRTFKC